MLKGSNQHVPMRAARAPGFSSGEALGVMRSIGITVAAGMLASTCFAELLVPSCFVVVQRLEEWCIGRRVAPAAAE